MLSIHRLLNKTLVSSLPVSFSDGALSDVLKYKLVKK